ncbi:MAG: hypothetical protein M1818_006815 [Claussenomyces sp. TS43310]|nr:MAG: hypothetical protein M1818_006815 [Claussenomyces sp. TS43310]
MDFDQVKLGTNDGSPSETAWEKDMRAHWRATKDPDEKYELQREWYTTKRPDDTPANVFLRTKWAGLFNRRVPILEIMVTVQNDSDKQAAQLRELENQLANLKLAQTAHNKKQAAKAEKNAAQWTEAISYLCYSCANEGCCNFATVIDRDSTTIECEICRQMDYSFYRPDHPHNGWFCSEECKEVGELAHQIKYHPCASKSACIQRDGRVVFTKPTSAEATVGITICRWCLEEEERFVYFCCRACGDKNYDYVHYPEDMQKWEEDRYEEDFEDGIEDTEMT